MGFQMVLVVKNISANAGDSRDVSLNLWVRKISWRRVRQPTPVFLSGEFHGQRSLAGYPPQGHKELDVTEAIYYAHICICITESCFCTSESNTVSLIIYTPI